MKTKSCRKCSPQGKRCDCPTESERAEQGPLDETPCSRSSTPETDVKAKRICGNWNNAGDRVEEFVLAELAARERLEKLEHERDEARKTAAELRDLVPWSESGPWAFSWENVQSVPPADEKTN